MTGYSDEKIIDGIISKNRLVINFMYRDYFPLIRSLIEKNSGTRQDAEDVFQDGLEALFIRCRERELVLNCALRSYFYAICRNIWLQRLERKYRLVYHPDLLVNDSEERYIGRESLTKEQKLARHKIFWKHFNQLPVDCRQILQMYIDRVPCKKVAEIFGFTDENYAKVRKYLCKQLLRKRIKRDPEFPNCINDEES